MSSHRISKTAGAAILLFAFLLLALPAQAFPPAPHYTVYGTVRDEFGQRLNVSGASVIFFRDGVEIVRREIGSVASLNQNYRFRFPMDMERAGTARYHELAQNPGEHFTLAVLINDILYHPIEMTVETTAQIGQPGERVRIDLTLGIDSDGDGLPDAWEQSQLYAAGILPDENGWRYDLLDRDGDFDNDGFSNWAEYIAGTYATDAADYLRLEVVEIQKTTARLSFFSILGKRYSVESSPDLKTWSPVPLYLENPDLEIEIEEGPPGVEETEIPPVIPLASYEATNTEAVEIFVDLVDPKHTFYRLQVR